MAMADISSRKAILEAIAEFDQLGQEAFLSKYGFGRARAYYLEHEGRRYDSKAIVGVAHGYQFPAEGPLKSEQFNGGEATVKRKLEELGFHVRVIQGKPNDSTNA